MEPFGFGQITGIDIEGELRGMLPSTEWKRSAYRKKPKQQKWYAGETISLGIGQGYNSFTMLQLAQARWPPLAAGGQRFTPHLVHDDRGRASTRARARWPSERAAAAATGSPSTSTFIHNAHGTA